ncbi:amidase [Flammeovirgaceae bacterium SG7u.111]|nr:amidase [Flammeovirgaceae bacterium SG7u.132]WPO35470.1 amidase [Flammeovirgaceae bacterium SG7u.111]
MRNLTKLAFIGFWVMINSCSAPQQSVDDIAETEKVLGLSFTQAERDSLRDGVYEMKDAYKALREFELPNDVPPSINFNPIPTEFSISQNQETIDYGIPTDVALPENKETLAFYTVAQLASLIKSQKISSVELTTIYLDRLKKYGDSLQCVVTLTEDLAMQQAKRADEELANGTYRGPLHGIPYGLKDLLAVKGYKTTWGAMPYKDQLIDETATVAKKLENAGGVLVAKLTLGALAWGDVWFGGKTRNPWDLSQGSSGSSAGSASATSAGLVAFSIGTETLGSIVSPSTRCGVSGLRPSFGRVSRAGAMALSWSMDKIGPICRSAQDCALVFDAIRGSDGLDQTIVDAPFNFKANRDISTLKVGYFKEFFDADYSNKENDQASLEAVREMGIEPVEVKMPDGLPIGALRLILSAEAAAAFEELTLSDKDDLLVRQIKNAWPNVFREARLIPAVEYIQANRVRYLLVQKVNELFKDYDVIITPSFGGNQLLVTNLTGHPCVVVPNGFNEKGSPTSISFLGNLFDEATILAFVKAYQDATDHDEKYPPLFVVD